MCSNIKLISVASDLPHACYAMPRAVESWPALGVTIRHNVQWIYQQTKALIRLKCTLMLAEMKGSVMTPNYLSLVICIWAGLRRQLGRPQ